MLMLRRPGPEHSVKRAIVLWLLRHEVAVTWSVLVCAMLAVLW